MWFNNVAAVKTHHGRYSTGFCQSQPCTKLKMSIILAIFEIGPGMKKRDRKEETNMILLWFQKIQKYLTQDIFIISIYFAESFDI